MRNNHFTLKSITSFILTILIVYSALPSLAYSIENVADSIEATTPDVPFSFQYEEDDLPFSELADAILDTNDVPFVIGLPLANERGHVKRLYKQEPDDHTVLFQNRNGSKTIYYFSKPVKQNGRDLNQNEISSRIINSESAVTISANRVSFPANSILPMRLTQEGNSRLSFYNIGHAEVFEWTPDSRDISYTDITKAVRDWSMTSSGEPSFDMISKSGEPVLLSGGGMLVMSLNYSDLAGDYSFKTFPESLGATIRYLRNSYPSAHNIMSLNTVQNNPRSRWLLLYDDGAFMIRSQSNNLKFICGDDIGGYPTLCDYDYDETEVLSMEHWYPNIVSSAPLVVSFENAYFTDVCFCHSGTTMFMEDPICLAGSEHLWELSNKNTAYSELLVIDPDDWFLTSSDYYYNPGCHLYGTNSYPTYYQLELRYVLNNQTIDYDDDEGGYYIPNQGISAICFFDIYSSKKSEPIYILNSGSVIEQSDQFDNKYLNISTVIGNTNNSLRYEQKPSTQNGMLISGAGLVSQLSTSDGLSPNQAFKLSYSNDNSFTLTFVMPEINNVSNIETGHVIEYAISSNISHTLVKSEELDATNNRQKWFLLYYNNSYFFLNKGSRKLLGHTASGSLNLTTNPSNCQWNIHLTGIYKIKEYNSGSNSRFLSVQDDYDTEGQQIITTDSTPTFHADRMVRIAYDFDNEGYAIYPVSSRNGYKKAVGINANNNAVLSTYDGLVISINRKLFTPQYNSSNYWTFLCAYNSTMALAVDSNQNVKAVAFNSSATNQRWEIITDNETVRQFKSEVYYKSLDIGSPVLDYNNGTLDVTYDYGRRSAFTTNHYGVDFRSLISYNLPYGYDLNSPCDGIISLIGSRLGSGYFLVVQGDNLFSYAEGEENAIPLYFYFCHLYGTSPDYQQLAVNSVVSKGDSLGSTSNTDGYSPSQLIVHLHMSVTTSGDYNNTCELQNINPLMFFDYNEYN